MSFENQYDKNVLSYVLKIFPWYTTKGRKWESFYVMNLRLISNPESNFQYWDTFKEKEIESYLARCIQLHKYMKDDSNFLYNWKNLKIALENIQYYKNLCDPLPFNDTPESFLSLEKTYNDLNLCCDLIYPYKNSLQIQDNNNIYSQYMNMYNQTESLILEEN